MPYIDMANIACGFHASDPVTMRRTVSLAVKHRVRIGAHPGYPDLVGFGRRDMALSADELFSAVLYQLGALDAIARAEGGEVTYVKPHGALYNKMTHDTDTLKTVMSAVARFKPDCPLMLMAGVSDQKARALAKALQLPLIFEAFCDRAYNDDGTLVSRKLPNAVHSDVQRVKTQIREIVHDKKVTTINGIRRSIYADTICLHGDSEHLLQAIKDIRSSLKQ